VIAMRGSVKNNIHYYNMDVNRDYGTVRTDWGSGNKGRLFNELENANAASQRQPHAFAKKRERMGHPKSWESRAAAPAGVGIRSCEEQGDRMMLQTGVQIGNCGLTCGDLCG